MKLPYWPHLKAIDTFIYGTIDVKRAQTSSFSNPFKRFKTFAFFMTSFIRENDRKMPLASFNYRKRPTKLFNYKKTPATNYKIGP